MQMWACALGHQRAAELLYSWNSSALGIPDSLGRLPLAVARSRGHTRLATALEELHTHMTSRDTLATPQPQLPPSPLSTSPDTGNAHLLRVTAHSHVTCTNALIGCLSSRSELLQQPSLPQRPLLPLPELCLLQWPCPHGHLPLLPLISFFILFLTTCLASHPPLSAPLLPCSCVYVGGGA